MTNGIDITRSIHGRWVSVRNRTGNREVARGVRLCRGFFDKLLGLMFRPRLPVEDGALLIYSQSSRAQTSIHMFFVPFPIGVFWLDENGVVIDAVRALPWRPFYASRVPARYVLELHPLALESLRIGDQVEFYEPSPRD